MDESKRIENMQKHLSVIRSVAGWSAERLGQEIGVTRQTVNNLERGKSKMTKTQYLALRAVFNHEAIVSDNSALPQVINSLVDDPIDDEEESIHSEGDEHEEGSNKVDAVAGMSAATKVLTDRKLLAALSKAVVYSAVPLVGGIAASASVIRDALKKVE